MKKTILLLMMTVALFMQDIIAQPDGRREDITFLSGAQRATLAAAMHNYITNEIIQEHACNNEYYNEVNDSWSIHGPEMFLNWHREYLAEMEESLKTTLNGMGLSLLPRWNPADGIDSILAFNLTDPDCEEYRCDGSSYPLSCADPINFPNGTNTNFPVNLIPTLTCSNWSSYEDFTNKVNNGYHGVGHRASGGVMRNYKSPAAPIFWLWHAMIDDIFWDYQQDCMPNAELYMKDNISDTGVEPSSGTLYLSHDIWVRLNKDTPTGSTSSGINLSRHPYGSESYMFEGIHQDPYHSPTKPNYVYVRIRNNSEEDFSGGRLHVYWSKASTGLNWPDTWVDYYPSGSSVLHGDELLPNITGQIPEESNFVIPPIKSGDQFIMEVPWYSVPNPNDFSNFVHHFCLLARIVSSHDAMTVPETSALWSNVANNNNIVWRNIDVFYDPNIFMIVNQGGGDIPDVIDENVVFTGIFVANAFEEPRLTRLEFNPVDMQGNPTFFEVGGAIFTRMDNEIFAKWEAGGFVGEGVNYLGEFDERHYVRIISPNAFIDNLLLDPNSNYALEMGFCLEAPIDPGQQFDFDLQQFDENGIVGGERYEVVITDQPEGKITSTEDQLEKASNFVVSPNPARNSFTLSYNLSEANDINFMMYDINGRLVSQQNKLQLSPGYQEHYYDVANLASGVYFIRIQMGTYMTTQKVIVE